MAPLDALKNSGVQLAALYFVKNKAY